MALVATTASTPIHAVDIVGSVSLAEAYCRICRAPRKAQWRFCMLCGCADFDTSALHSTVQVISDIAHAAYVGHSHTLTRLLSAVSVHAALRERISQPVFIGERHSTDKDPHPRLGILSTPNQVPMFTLSEAGVSATPLHYAALGCSAEAVMSLVLAGASPLTPSPDGTSVTQIAVAAGDAVVYAIIEQAIRLTMTSAALFRDSPAALQPQSSWSSATRTELWLPYLLSAASSASKPLSLSSPPLSHARASPPLRDAAADRPPRVGGADASRHHAPSPHGDAAHAPYDTRYTDAAAVNRPVTAAAADAPTFESVARDFAKLLDIPAPRADAPPCNALALQQPQAIGGDVRTTASCDGGSRADSASVDASVGPRTRSDAGLHSIGTPPSLSAAGSADRAWPATPASPSLSPPSMSFARHASVRSSRPAGARRAVPDAVPSQLLSSFTQPHTASFMRQAGSRRAQQGQSRDGRMGGHDSVPRLLSSRSMHSARDTTPTPSAVERTRLRGVDAVATAAATALAALVCGVGDTASPHRVDVHGVEMQVTDGVYVDRQGNVRMPDARYVFPDGACVAAASDAPPPLGRVVVAADGYLETSEGAALTTAEVLTVRHAVATAPLLSAAWLGAGGTYLRRSTSCIRTTRHAGALHRAASISLGEARLRGVVFGSDTEDWAGHRRRPSGALPARTLPPSDSAASTVIAQRVSVDGSLARWIGNDVSGVVPLPTRGTRSPERGTVGSPAKHALVRESPPDSIRSGSPTLTDVTATATHTDNIGGHDTPVVTVVRDPTQRFSCDDDPGAAPVVPARPQVLSLTMGAELAREQSADAVAHTSASAAPTSNRALPSGPRSIARHRTSVGSEPSVQSSLAGGSNPRAASFVTSASESARGARPLRTGRADAAGRAPTAGADRDERERALLAITAALLGAAPRSAPPAAVPLLQAGLGLRGDGSPSMTLRGVRPLVLDGVVMAAHAAFGQRLAALVGGAAVRLTAAMLAAGAVGAAQALLPAAAALRGPSAALQSPADATAWLAGAASAIESALTSGGPTAAAEVATRAMTVALRDRPTLAGAMAAVGPGTMAAVETDVLLLAPISSALPLLTLTSRGARADAPHVLASAVLRLTTALIAAREDLSVPSAVRRECLASLRAALTSAALLRVLGGRVADALLLRAALVRDEDAVDVIVSTGAADVNAQHDAGNAHIGALVAAALGDGSLDNVCVDSGVPIYRAHVLTPCLAAIIARSDASLQSLVDAGADPLGAVPAPELLITTLPPGGAAALLARALMARGAAPHAAHGAAAPRDVTPAPNMPSRPTTATAPAPGDGGSVRSVRSTAQPQLPATGAADASFGASGTGSARGTRPPPLATARSTAAVTVSATQIGSPAAPAAPTLPQPEPVALLTSPSQGAVSSSRTTDARPDSGHVALPPIGRGAQHSAAIAGGARVDAPPSMPPRATGAAMSGPRPGSEREIHAAHPAAPPHRPPSAATTTLQQVQQPSDVPASRLSAPIAPPPVPHPATPAVPANALGILASQSTDRRIEALVGPPVAPHPLVAPTGSLGHPTGSLGHPHNGTSAANPTISECLVGLHEVLRAHSSPGDAHDADSATRVRNFVQHLLPQLLERSDPTAQLMSKGIAAIAAVVPALLSPSGPLLRHIDPGVVPQLFVELIAVARAQHIRKVQIAPGALLASAVAAGGRVLDAVMSLGPETTVTVDQLCDAIFAAALRPHPHAALTTVVAMPAACLGSAAAAREVGTAVAFALRSVLPPTKLTSRVTLRLLHTIASRRPAIVVEPFAPCVPPPRFPLRMLARDAPLAPSALDQSAIATAAAIAAGATPPEPVPEPTNSRASVVSDEPRVSLPDMTATWRGEQAARSAPASGSETPRRGSDLSETNRTMRAQLLRPLERIPSVPLLSSLSPLRVGGLGVPFDDACANAAPAPQVVGIAAALARRVSVGPRHQPSPMATVTARDYAAPLVWLLATAAPIGSSIGAMLHELIPDALSPSDITAINAAGPTGETLATYAVRTRRVALLRALLELGEVDPHQRDAFGRTPSTLASASGGETAEVMRRREEVVGRAAGRSMTAGRRIAG